MDARAHRRMAGRALPIPKGQGPHLETTGGESGGKDHGERQAVFSQSLSACTGRLERVQGLAADESQVRSGSGQAKQRQSSGGHIRVILGIAWRRLDPSSRRASLAESHFLWLSPKRFTQFFSGLSGLDQKRKSSRNLHVRGFSN